MKKWSIYIILLCFMATGLQPVQAQGLSLPATNTRLAPSAAFAPPVLKGIKVNPKDPFRFNFLLDPGTIANTSRPDDRDHRDRLTQESNKLISYFLASLTIPEKDLWVNLSPYEKDRIIPDGFGRTQMGMDLLAQDYILKQLTAGLMYPDDAIGKAFWAKVYAAAKKAGVANIPVNTFNKVWIVPEKAVVYENAASATAYVGEARLKVMLEEDYLAIDRNRTAGDAGQSVRTAAAGPAVSAIIRETIVPVLEKEVNEGAHFAQLRQVYHSLILANWYKKKVQDSILASAYADRNKTAGVDSKDPQLKQKIYAQYVQAFKKGAYSLIREEQDPLTQKTVPRKYFSGGITNLGLNIDYKTASQTEMLALMEKTKGLLEADAAMSVIPGDDGTAAPFDLGQFMENVSVPSTRLDQNFAKQLAEDFFAYLPLNNPLKQKVIRGEIPERNALAAIRHLLIEISISSAGQVLMGQTEFTAGEFPLNWRDLHVPSRQEKLTKVALDRLKDGAARPDIFSRVYMEHLLRGKNILITGGSGYLGPAVIRALLEMGANVIVYTRNPQSMERIAALPGVTLVQGGLARKSLAEAMEKYKIEGVIHLAAETLAPVSNEKPGRFYNTNVVGTAEVAKAMGEAGVKNMVFASSTLVYNGDQGTFLEEDTMPDPKTPYGATKYLAEMYLKEMKDKRGINYVSLRIFNVAGAFEWLGAWYGDNSLSHIVPRMVTAEFDPDVKFAIMGENFPTRDGTAIRDFVHPLDVAEAYVRSLAHLFDNGEPLILNVGTNKGVSLKEMFTTFRKSVAGTVGKIPFAPARLGDPADLRANTIRMQLELGWSPKRTVLEILSSDLQYRRWLKENKVPAHVQAPQGLDAKLQEEAQNLWRVYQYIKQADISPKLRFETLFMLFVATIGPAFPKAPALSQEIIRKEAELHAQALKIQANPAGMIDAVYADQPFQGDLWAFYTLLAKYRKMPDGRRKPATTQSSIDSFKMLLIVTLVEALREFPQPHVHGYQAPLVPTAKVREILQNLGWRHEFSPKIRREMARSEFIANPSVLAALARQQRLTTDPVNRPGYSDVLVPVYGGPKDENPRALKWRWAAKRDKDWYKVAVLYVFNHKGELYCQHRGDEFAATLEEAVQAHPETAFLDMIKMMRLPVAPGMLQPLPLHYYDFDPYNEKQGLGDDGIFYVKASRAHWTQRDRRVQMIRVVHLTADQEEAWLREGKGWYQPIPASEILRRHAQDGKTGLSERMTADINSDPQLRAILEEAAKDRAQSAAAKQGGIDLQRSMEMLQVRRQGRGIHIDADPVKLRQLRDAAGLVPVTVRITPLRDIRAFLGLPQH